MTLRLRAAEARYGRTKRGSRRRLAAPPLRLAAPSSSRSLLTCASPAGSLHDGPKYPLGSVAEEVPDKALPAGIPVPSQIPNAPSLKGKGKEGVVDLEIDGSSATAAGSAGLFKLLIADRCRLGRSSNHDTGRKTASGLYDLVKAYGHDGCDMVIAIVAEQQVTADNIAAALSRPDDIKHHAVDIHSRAATGAHHPSPRCINLVDAAKSYLAHLQRQDAIKKAGALCCSVTLDQATLRERVSTSAQVRPEGAASSAGPPPDFHDMHWFSESVPHLAVRYRYKGTLANTTETRMAEKLLLRQIEEVMTPAKHPKRMAQPHRD